MTTAVTHTVIHGCPVRHGKVRDIYTLDDDLLLMVTTDRISAFDYVLPTPIPDKGRVLTQLTAFWLRTFNSSLPHHLCTNDLNEIEDISGLHLNPEIFAGRTMLVKRTDPVPIECVARGYLAGSAWVEYQQSNTVCGLHLPAGLVESARLPSPIFTPATKAQTGHDENISFDQAGQLVGQDLIDDLRERSLRTYTLGAKIAAASGIIIADTKFEFGRLHEQTLVIDEVLTPDSSRFWPAASYRPGRGQPSFDKQFVRDYLVQTGWDRNSLPPLLPDNIVAQTRAKYIESYERLTGQQFQWK